MKKIALASVWLQCYEWRHIVGFEETSLVQTVYFTNYLLWQGRCRELFIRENAPEVKNLLMDGDIALITKSCSCNFQGQRGLYALEEVLVKMSIIGFCGGRCFLGFRYYNCNNSMDFVAEGLQEVRCQNKSKNGMVPSTFPKKMMSSFSPIAANSDISIAIQDASEFSKF